MNCTIPFTKDVKFETNIAEILSISLEHEYTVNEGELLGNFIITGEYKTHEVSVNRESFEYVLPFAVNLTKPIDPDTVDFEIQDFTYDLVDNNTLKVNIEYSVKAVEAERTADVFEEIPVEDTAKAEEIMAEVLEEKEEERNVAVPAAEISEEEKKSEDISAEENVILNTITGEENNFVTYHIHIYKENDTIETICSKYNTNTSILENYNDLKNLTVGDKILIPDLNE